jgi:hypothetical protein
MLRSESPEGFAAYNSPQTPPMTVTREMTVGGNPYIRCSLPPLNAVPDTLRQFSENGQTPTRRVIPLPISTVAGSSKITYNVTAPSSSSGSVTPATFKLSEKTVTVDIPSIIPGGNYQTQVKMSTTFQLISLTATQPVEVRVYSDARTQGADVVRPTDSPVPFEVLPGVITDVVFDTAPFSWNWQNRIGANSDPIQTATVYVTVVNPSSVGVPPSTLQISFVPLVS